MELYIKNVISYIKGRVLKCTLPNCYLYHNITTKIFSRLLPVQISFSCIFPVHQILYDTSPDSDNVYNLQKWKFRYDKNALKKIVQEVHTLNLLRKICTSIYIERE